MALAERFQRNVDATNWPGEIPMNYLYTAGRAGEVFFTALRDEEKIVGARCDKCGTVTVPPQIFCERCFENIEGQWEDVPNLGIVQTYTVSHETYDEQPKEPTLLVMVTFEGTIGGIFHRLEGADPCDCLIGMPVKAVFKPKAERTGSILDIDHFEPLG